MKAILPIKEVPSTCPLCGSQRIYEFLKTSSPERYFKCKVCFSQFTAKRGTFFKESKLPTKTLNILIEIYNSAKGQLSAKDIERNLRVTYVSAYYLLKDLDSLSGFERPTQKFTGKYVGKCRNKPYAVLKEREQRRKDLVLAVLNSKGEKSLQEIALKIAPKHPLESCSLLVNSARKWKWYDGKITGEEIPKIIARRAIQILPQYERPEIPNEQETEIAFLTKRRNILSLDEYIFDGDTDRHSMYGSETLSPLELLMLKEERETEEYHARELRMEQWRRFQERRNSAFQEIIMAK